MNWRDMEERVRSTSERTGAARIEITSHGPYRVTGDVVIFDAEGNLLRHGGTWCLCRCGGSRNKPFCDATHGLKGFDGSESADHGSIADRRDRYVADGDHRVRRPQPLRPLRAVHRPVAGRVPGRRRTVRRPPQRRP